MRYGLVVLEPSPRAAKAETGKSGAEGQGSPIGARDGGSKVTDPNHPSREEINARLEAVEARLDGKLASMDGKLDRLADQMGFISKEIGLLSREVESARVAAESAESASTSTKWNILFTGLTVGAILLAAFALWAQGVEMVTGLVEQFSGGAPK